MHRWSWPDCLFLSLRCPFERRRQGSPLFLGEGPGSAPCVLPDGLFCHLPGVDHADLAGAFLREEEGRDAGQLWAKYWRKPLSPTCPAQGRFPSRNPANCSFGNLATCRMTSGIWAAFAGSCMPARSFSWSIASYKGSGSGSPGRDSMNCFRYAIRSGTFP